MTLEHSTNSDQQLAESASPNPSIVVLDPLTLRRSCIAHILNEWSKAEGLTIKSVARIGARSQFDLNPNCRLLVINVGGKSVTDNDVVHNIETARMMLPKAPLIIMSDLDDRTEVFAAFQAGAVGYIPTSLDPTIALRAFTFILGGGSYFPPSALSPTTLNAASSVKYLSDTAITEPQFEPDEQQATVASQRFAILTVRQRQVANLLKDGLPNKMIARHLGMTEATVKVHVRQIMRKLGVNNRTQVALSICSNPQDAANCNPDS